MNTAHPNDQHGEFLTAIELHAVDQLEAVLNAGLELNAPIRGRLPIDWLLAMYTRSDAMADCLRLLMDRGATLPDPAVGLVLLNNADSLAAAIQSGARDHQSSHQR